MSEERSEERSLAMPNGSRQHLAVSAGTTILVRSGSVILRSGPVWLGESCLQPQQRLDAEDVHVAATEGWLELSALSAAELVVIPAPSLSQWVCRCVQAWLGRQTWTIVSKLR